MMYLEDLLKTMDGKADVMVMLSSETTYECGLKMQDCCGNHWVKNWLDAIERKSLRKLFIVKDVEITFEEYMDAPQWKVTLKNKKSHETNMLNYESNSSAVKTMWEV